MDCTPIPPTPEAKKTSFTIPKMFSFDSSLPTPAQRPGNSKSTKTKPTRPKPTKPRPRPTKPTKPTKPRPPKILLSEGPKKMVWTELSKIKQVRLLQSKAHSITHNIREARARDSILPMFEVNKSLPQLPGGPLSWALKTEWTNILRDCSQKLMLATADFLVGERLPDLDKQANNLAELALNDLSKAFPEEEKQKGLQLFNIVDQSMKRRVNKSGKVAKPSRRPKSHKSSRPKLN